MFFLLFFSLLFSPLWATGEGWDTLAHAPTSPSLPTEGSVEGVNVVTGSFLLAESEGITRGIDPLSVERYYFRDPSRRNVYVDLDSPNCLGWYLFYDETIWFPSAPNSVYTTLAVSQKAGNFIHYARTKAQGPLLPQGLKGYMNHLCGEISGQNHLQNTYVSYEGRESFTLYKGDGSLSRYRGKVSFRKESGIFGAGLVEERKPSGNRVIPWAGGRQTLSREGGIILNWVSVSERTREEPWTIRTSDQRTFFYLSTKSIHRKEGGDIFLLKQVKRPDGSQIAYRYNERVFKSNDLLLAAKEMPEGRFFQLHYTNAQVTTFLAPLGVDQTPFEKYRFRYGNGYTDVYDALQNAKRYMYDSAQRITQVVTYDPQGRSYRTEKNEWDQKGCLCAKRLLDGAGREVFARLFSYDERGNVVKETVQGAGGSYTKHYTYSTEGSNLLTSESDGVALTEYAYLPGTNLLTSKIIKEGGVPRLKQRRQYDECGALTELIEEDGPTPTCRKITTWRNCKAFPGVGQPAEKEEGYEDLPTGRRVVLKRSVYHYNPHNECIQEDVYGADGSYAYSIHRTYDALGRLLTESDPLGHVTSRGYDGNGNLLFQKGPLPGFLIKHGYDYMNRLIWTREQDANGHERTKRYRYDRCGHRVAETDDQGNETQFVYDFLGRESEILYPPVLDEENRLVVHRVKKNYDVTDAAIEWWDERGEGISTLYTFRGQPSLRRHMVSGRQEEFLYDPRGNLLCKTAVDGSAVRYTYDFLDRVLTTSHVTAQGEILSTTSSTYSPLHLLSTTDAEGNRVTFEYDGAGREICMRQGERCVWTSYDKLGFVASVQEGDLKTVYERDAVGHVLKEWVEDGEGRLYSTIEYRYDARGKCIEKSEYQSDQVTATTYYTFDGWGREIERQDPLGHLTRVEYREGVVDGEGNQGLYEKRTDPLGHVVERFFDARGQLVKEKRGEVREVRRRYDGCGHLLVERHLCAEGEEKITYRYGPEGRLESVIDPQGCVKSRYTYNLKGEMVQEETPLGCHTFTYDGQGNVATHKASSKGESKEVRYTYDRCGRVIKIAHKGGCVEKRYGQRGELLFEKQESGAVLRYTYDVLGRRRAMELPDGSQVRYHYEGPYLHTLARWSKGGKELYRHCYEERDGRGRSLVQELAGAGGKVERRYDLAGRQISLCAAQWKQQVTYNAVGEIVSLETVDVVGKLTTSFAYDELSQLIQEGTWHFSYDSKGNRQEMEVGPLNQLLSSPTHRYDYDEEGRLTEVEGEQCRYDPLGQMVQYHKTSYAYDGLGRRVKRNNNHYLYDGNREIGRVDGEGRILEFRLLGEEQEVVALELEGGRYAALCDVQGSVVCAVGLRNGKPEETCRYTAYGEQTRYALNRVPLVESAVQNPWGYCGKRQDRESGWIFFGRRYYLPEAGRFATPDPLGYTQGLNLYLFVNNNPLTHFDLYGYLDERGPLESRSCFNFLEKLGRFFMSGIEWVGKNLIPLPGVRDVVEAVGRWGAGGKLFEWAEYVQCHTRLGLVEGKRVEGVTLVWINGVYTREWEARKAAHELSEKYGGIEVVMLYNSTQGLIADLMECCLLKLGGLTPPEKLIIEFVKNSLKSSPDERVLIYAHSQGGLHLYNAGKRLSSDERARIEAFTFGTAKIIPKEMFSFARNYISRGDIVPMFDTFNYLKALVSESEHVVFLSPTSYCPFKEHMISESSTYGNQIKELGDKFRNKHL